MEYEPISQGWQVLSDQRSEFDFDCQIRQIHASPEFFCRAVAWLAEILPFREIQSSSQPQE
jgi:hypothetical protein